MFPNQSSIEILILKINSIASMSNSNTNHKVGYLFHFDFWFWISAFWLSIDQQTSIFFNLTLDLINYSPYVHMPFLVWSLILNFFNQVSNSQSIFNIYAIKPLIWLNILLNFNFCLFEPPQLIFDHFLDAPIFSSHWYIFFVFLPTIFEINFYIFFSFVWESQK